MFGFVRYKTCVRKLIPELTSHISTIVTIRASMKESPRASEYDYREQCRRIDDEEKALEQMVLALVIITPKRKREWLRGQIQALAGDRRRSERNDCVDTVIMHLEHYSRCR